MPPEDLPVPPNSPRLNAQVGKGEEGDRMGRLMTMYSLTVKRRRLKTVRRLSVLRMKPTYSPLHLEAG